MLPKVLFFERQPSPVQIASRKGEHEGEGCFLYGCSARRLNRKKGGQPQWLTSLP
jgi:hypothetical protein